MLTLFSCYSNGSNYDAGEKDSKNEKNGKNY